MAHPRQEHALGLALALRAFTFAPCAVGVAGVGHVPIDADLLSCATRFVYQLDRTRGKPSHLAVGADDAEFVFARGPLVHRRGRPRLDPHAVFGVHAGHALFGRHGLRPGCMAAEQPHLRVPMCLTRVEVQFPGAQAGASGGESCPFVGSAQGPLRVAPFSQIDHHAEQQPAV